MTVNNVKIIFILTVKNVFPVEISNIMILIWNNVNLVIKVVNHVMVQTTINVYHVIMYNINFKIIHV